MRMQLESQTITPKMSEIKAMIAETVAQRSQLKMQMESWYDEHPTEHFPAMKELILIDSTLSELDTFYKQLWDYNNAKSYAE